MNDEDFLERVAKYWISLGGDSDGLRFFCIDLLIRIDELLGEES